MKKLLFLALLLIPALQSEASSIFGVCPSLMSPALSSDPTTGFCTAGAGLIDLYVGGTKVVEWSSSGPALQVIENAHYGYFGPTSGSPAAPTWRALVGADLPNPSASTLGGVESIAAVPHNFLTSISTSGVPAQAQPSITDLVGVPASTTVPSVAGEIMAASNCSPASAATMDIGAACTPGQVVTPTGTTGITSLGPTAVVGSAYDLYFTTVIALTNSATLSLPGATNFTSASGFGLRCKVPSVAGTWVCSLTDNPLVSWSSGGSVTLSGGVTTGRINVTASTIPANGSYLRVTNNPCFSSNTTLAGCIDASQRLLWGYTADQGGGELFQVNSGIYANGKVTATNLLDSGLSASAPVVSTDASKNLTTTAPTQTANTVYAGPSSGGAASPTFRALVTADMPSGFIPVFSGTSGSIGGGALLAGACSSGTATVTGATTSMVALVDPSTYPGDGAYWDGYVSSANTVTVKVCATVALTPTASTYNVRVLQ